MELSSRPLSSSENQNFFNTSQKLLENENLTFPTFCYFTRTIKFVSHFFYRILAYSFSGKLLNKDGIRKTIILTLQN